MTLQLMPHQEAAVQAVLGALHFEGVHRQVIAMATGAGKTITAGALASLLLEGEGFDTLAPGGRCLFLAHREEIVQQSLKAFLHFFPPHELGFMWGGHYQPGARHLFAMVQSLNQERVQRMLVGGPFQFVVVDECHHAPSKSYRTLVGEIGETTPLVGPNTLLLGMTATPSRNDGLSLRTVFEQLTYSVGILDLITADPPYLCDLRRIGVEIPDLTLDLGEEDDFDTKALARAIKQSSQHTLAVQAIQHYVPNDRGIYFGPTIDEIVDFAEVANDHGLRTEVLTGETLEYDRKQMIARSQAGVTQYLANVGVLTEGTDMPWMRVAVIGRHTRSKELYLQCIGRVVRPLPEERDLPYAQWTKKEALVIDLFDHQHTVTVLPELLGTTELRMDAMPTVKELAESGEIVPRPKPLIPVYAPQGRLHVEAGSLFTNRPWRRSGEDYQLLTDYGTYLARRTFADTYELVQYPKQGKPRRLLPAAKLEHALGKGEEHLKAQEVRDAKRRDPVVRQQWADPAQVARLRATRFPIKAGARLTVGQVQDYWDQLKECGTMRVWFSRYGPWRKKAHL